MSSLALMRLLESAPQRYDSGMRWLTLGRASHMQHVVARAAVDRPGRCVLEIGCGTGALTELLLARGAQVTAFDQNPEMLQQARRRLGNTLGEALTFVERTAAEIDALPEQSFDAVVASFAFSEMSPDERSYVLREAFRRLRNGGVLCIADEARPLGFVSRVLAAALRAPQALLGWLWVGSVSHPLAHLVEEIAGASFKVRHEQRYLIQTYACVVAERPR